MKLKRYCDATIIVKGVEQKCNRQLIMTMKHEITDHGVINFYQCGHFHYKPHLNKIVDFTVKSLDGTKEAYPFQVEGIQFLLDNDCNGFLGDQMGLGKTIQLLLALKVRKDSQKPIFPCLILVKGSTLYQWEKQYKTWTSTNPMGTWIVRNGKDWIPPGFDVYLMSMDTLRSFVTNKERSKVDLRVIGIDESYSHTKITLSYKINGDLKAIGFKSVIADEVHSFKDPSSARTIAFIEFCKQFNIEHKMFASGTAIKNRAEEFFVPLNLLDPENIPSLDGFRHKWLMQDTTPTGRKKNSWSRLNPYRYEQFKEMISNYFIRRERNEVLKDLPKFRRTFTDVMIEDDNLINLYNKEIDKLAQLSTEKENISYFDISDNLMSLRKIIGVAKASFVDSWVEMFLEETDDEKIAIGVHHHAVRDLLKSKLVAYAPLVISGDDNAEEKYRKVQEFAKPFRRVMILNTLAGGTGTDGLQVCNNVLTVERQWSAADEEQFEDRFNRIGQTRPVDSEYFIAKGTIDEWLHNLVERKRLIFGETIGNNWDFKNDANAIKDMIDWAVVNKLKS